MRKNKHTLHCPSLSPTLKTSHHKNIASCKRVVNAGKSLTFRSGSTSCNTRGLPQKTVRISVAWPNKMSDGISPTMILLYSLISGNIPTAWRAIEGLGLRQLLYSVARSVQLKIWSIWPPASEISRHIWSWRLSNWSWVMRPLPTPCWLVITMIRSNHAVSAAMESNTPGKNENSDGTLT